jgi:hypothetical protein
MTGELHPAVATGRSQWLRTGLVLSGLFGLATLALRLEGRRWWCRCGRLAPWTGNIWSEHNSQHLFDPYTFTHVEHGLLLYALLRPLARWVGPGSRLVLAMTVETLWEIVENTPPVIENYRKAAVARGYVGDSVANSLADIAACGLGLILARRLPVRWSIAVFVVIETGLLIIYRDNLLLTVVMQFFPLDSVQSWQMGP